MKSFIAAFVAAIAFTVFFLFLLFMGEQAEGAEGLKLHNQRPVGWIDPMPSVEMQTRVFELAKWIEEHSDLGPMKNAPAILYLRPEELEYARYGTVNHPSGTAVLEVAAMYLMGTNIMMLSEGFKLGVHDDTLLHELVHHLQSEAGMEFPCPGVAERQAYDLTDEWTAESGIGEISDPLTVFLITQCEEGGW